MADLEFAPDLAKRASLSKELKLKHRLLEHDYGVYSGRYGFFFSPDNFIIGEDNVETSVEELSEYEKLILKQIGLILDKKHKNNEAQELIFVDFGGGAGASAVKIAKEASLKYPNMVSIIVTNLGAIDFEERCRIIAEKTPDLLDFYKANQAKVKFIESDAAELRFALGGKKIDILNESFALTWGLQNDVDWFLLARLMSKYGTLIAQSYGEGMHADGKQFGIRQALLGKSNLIGLRNIRTILQEQYFNKTAFCKVFLATEAPKIDEEFINT